MIYNEEDWPEEEYIFTGRGTKRVWAIALAIALALFVLLVPAVAAPGGGIWRAGISIFMTSDDAPMSMMLGKFPKPFTSEGDCKTFIKDIEKKVHSDIVSYSSPSEQIVNHELFCVLDESGDAI